MPIVTARLFPYYNLGLGVLLNVTRFDRSQVTGRHVFLLKIGTRYFCRNTLITALSIFEVPICLSSPSIQITNHFFVYTVVEPKLGHFLYQTKMCADPNLFMVHIIHHSFHLSFIEITQKN